MMLKPTAQYHIFVFRAIDEPALCKAYIDGHRKVLSDYGIENVTTNTDDWMYNPHIYCTVIQDRNSNELVGGVRIQIADGKHPLPVERAIGYMDHHVFDKVRHYALDGGIGESCGLWISKKVKQMGLSRYLMWASIASSEQLKFQTMLGICAGYTLKLFGSLGFVIDMSLGEHGGFPYPNEKYIAHVIGILNAITLETSDQQDKEVMLSLRNKPVQERVENNNGFTCHISYDIIYKNIVPVVIDDYWTYSNMLSLE